MLPGFAVKRGFIERKTHADRIELHNIHQHAAGGVHQRAYMKSAVADAAADWRGNAGVIERNLLRRHSRLRLFHGGGGDVTLHLRGVDIITADRVVGFKTLVARQQLLRLTQRGLRAFQLRLRQR